MSSDDPTEGLAGLDLGNLGAMFGQVMEQARSVQTKVAETQERVKEITVEGTSGGGLVKVVAAGDGRIQTVRIDPICVDKRDIEMLEDLITAAVNDAIRRAKDVVEKEMGSIAGGMDLGPLGDMLGKMGGGNPFGS
jgi:DNA-binding YbaB/EbfC family protein